MTNSRLINPSCRLLAGTLLIFALLIPGVGLADDRDLVREGGRVPYLMVLFDVSGSMNWGPQGDPFVPASGDDVNSKFYQAKSALFRVVSDPELDDIFWGFATYNQDSLRAYRKHWLYTPTEAPAWVLDGRLPYPAPGQAKFFGDNCQDGSDSNTDCDLDGNDRLRWCGEPHILGSAESWGELLSFPVTGEYGTWETEEWVRFNNTTYEVETQIVSGNLGDPTIEVQLELKTRFGGCSDSTTRVGFETITFERVQSVDTQGRPLSGGSQFLNWQIDNRTDANGNPSGFWNPDDTRATNTCAGWDPNDDSSADDTVGVNLRSPTQIDPSVPPRPAIMNRGDIIPLDWESGEVWGVSNKDAILKRLAPNYDPNDPSFVPDFRVAPYFQPSADSQRLDADRQRDARLPGLLRHLEALRHRRRR
jgi:hypothetical protein